jgi:hypothetical protein
MRRECALDLVGQREILFRHAAGVMRRADESDACIVDQHVGMMVGLLGYLSDPADKVDAVHESLELIALADGVVLVLPPGQRFNFGRDFIRGKFRHRHFLPPAGSAASLVVRLHRILDQLNAAGA